VNLTLIQEIKCYEDALNLYEKVESNRSQLKTMLQDVLAQARQAMKEVQIVEDQLFEADLQASRARTIIKKSGFADVLQKKNFVELPNQIVRLLLRIYYSKVFTSHHS
jgi:hypothetical protein